MKNLFVPIDFSDNSARALAYAMHLAQDFDSRLIVHHVIMDPPALKDEEDVKSDYRHRIMEFSEGIMKASGIEKLDISASVSISPDIESIAKLEQMVFVDLVIMGTQGASGLKELFLGSNTVKVIDQIKKPVLTIPLSAVYKRPEYIMLCSDYDATKSDDVFHLVKSMAMHYDSEVRISHVKTDEKPHREDHVLESKKEGHYFDPEVRYSYKLIRRSSVVEGINYYIDLKGDNDMVVVLSRDHNLLEKMFSTSHTHKMAYHSTLPLLVLKDV